jgi:hypothetical protein
VEKLLAQFGDWRWRSIMSFRIHPRPEKIPGGEIEYRETKRGELQYRVRRERSGTARDTIARAEVDAFLRDCKPLLAEGLSYSKRHAARCDPMHLHSIFFQIEKGHAQLRAILAGQQARYVEMPLRGGVPEPPRGT